MTATANMEGAAHIAADPHTATVLVGIVDGGVALLRADTGAIIWRKQAGGDITGLAHGGDIVYIAISSGIRPDPRPLRGPGPFPSTPIIRDASGDPVLERDPDGRCDYHISMGRVSMKFDLARVEARRATDGALLWNFTNTSLPNWAEIALDGETLAICSPMNMLSDESVLFGLDARTGAMRWRKTYRHDGEAASGSREETDDNRALRHMIPVRLRNLLGTRNGRFYVEVWSARAPTDTPGPMRLSHRIEALDAVSGALLWSREIDLDAQRALLSWGGALVMDEGKAPANGRVLTARRTSDGALVGTLTYQGDLRGMSDDGVAYVLEGERDRLLRALRINGASAESASQEGMQGKPDAIFVTRAIQLDRNRRNRRNRHDNRVELRALDLETGATRWTWRSPKNLMALLRLWGLRAPGAFAASVFRQLRKYGPALMSGIQRELGAGQWRHPVAMHEYGTRIDTVGDAVYLSGRLGVFALRVRDGQFLWFALPNVEINTRLPLLVSPS